MTNAGVEPDTYGELVGRLLRHKDEPMHHWEDHLNRADSLMSEAATAIETLVRAWIEADEDAKVQREFLAVMDARADAAEAKVAQVERERDEARRLYNTLVELSLGMGSRMTAAEAEVAKLRDALSKVVADYDACSGAEPSLSVLHRTIDIDARRALRGEP